MLIIRIFVYSTDISKMEEDEKTKISKYLNDHPEFLKDYLIKHSLDKPELTTTTAESIKETLNNNNNNNGVLIRGGESNESSQSSSPVPPDTVLLRQARKSITSDLFHQWLTAPPLTRTSSGGGGGTQLSGGGSGIQYITIQYLKYKYAHFGSSFRRRRGSIRLSPPPPIFRIRPNSNFWVEMIVLWS